MIEAKMGATPADKVMLQANARAVRSANRWFLIEGRPGRRGIDRRRSGAHGRDR